jgi:hypothetical protein
MTHGEQLDPQQSPGGGGRGEEEERAQARRMERREGARRVRIRRLRKGDVAMRDSSDIDICYPSCCNRELSADRGTGKTISIKFNVQARDVQDEEMISWN